MTVGATPATPVLLVILDGFGCRSASDDNAISRARMPHWDRLWRQYAHTTLDASELHVGLPEGQMGNSEVGHLNIGAGRVVYQDLTRIDKAIADGDFFHNAALLGAAQAVAASGRALHVMGLLSPGGVHSHERHLAAMVELAARAGVKRTLVHAFLDGRDTPPRSATASLQRMDAVCSRHPGARIASIVGRYYAMDRDQRWERVQAAYELLVDGRARYRAENAESALEAAYARGENDEFVAATAIVPPGGEPARMEDGDAVVFMNFRADRARQITRALTARDFASFPRGRWPALARYVCLSSYGDEFAALPVAFAPQTVTRGFGEVVAGAGIKQLRIAETEKYAHVTYFFNGGVEEPYAGEDRVLVPSPKVATYDLKPEMSAFEVTEKLVAAIETGNYGDMVGHTGNIDAAIKAIETLDTCVGRVVEAQQRRGGEVLISADHGNAEMMFDPQTGQPHTAHTLNRVPCLYVGRRATLSGEGALKDIAPTLLQMMGLPQPREMTGRGLIQFA
jgi:2,3-bisphosphoglycerate-independent phosphoglycerate mutase